MAEQIRKKPRGRQPITRHPLFAATVALWCGAILSLAGAVAAPQLGVPLILGLGAVGAVAGLILARRFAAPKAPAAPPAEPDVAVAPTGESADPLWSELRSHRRAIEEEQAGVDFAAPEPPVLARAPEILDIAIADSAPLPPEEVAAEPLAEVVPPPLPKPESAAAARLRQADLENLSHVELLERLALGLEQRRRGTAADAQASEAAGAAPTGHVAALRKSYQALVELARHVPSPPPAGTEAPVVFPAEADRRAAPRPAGPSASKAATALAYDPAESPVVAGQPLAPDETEKALRAALAALQRMSGGA